MLESWLKNIKKWVDGQDVLDEPGQPRSRSSREDFIVAIAREIDRVLREEMFTPPGGPTYIPRQYIVFLSPDADAEWQGEKRDGLQKGLNYAISERIKELESTSKFQTDRIKIELRVDATLEKDRFRVQAIWDKDETTVRPRAQKDAEETVVRAREPLFFICVARAGQEPQKKHFHKSEITVGRGSRQIEVDLKLEGDQEVSRRHATIIKRGDGLFTITCHSPNPITLPDGRELYKDESAELRPGDKISICSFELVIG
jgi:hypothetical protein